MTGRRAAGDGLLLACADLIERLWLARVLAGAGYEVTEAEGVAQAVLAMRHRFFGAAVLDHPLVDGTALDLLRYLALHAPGCRSVVVVTDGAIAEAVQAMRLGAFDVLPRPVHEATLLASLRRPGATPPTAALAEVERKHVEAAVRDCDGNLTHAAVRLGLSRRTLQRRKRRESGGSSPTGEA
jgi:ActR/RegA family two-component response regulator